MVLSAFKFNSYFSKFRKCIWFPSIFKFKWSSTNFMVCQMNCGCIWLLILLSTHYKSDHIVIRFHFQIKNLYLFHASSQNGINICGCFFFNLHYIVIKKFVKLYKLPLYIRAVVEHFLIVMLLYLPLINISIYSNLKSTF